MSKAPVAIVLMAAGMLAVAGVVYLQTNRYAFTRLATSSNPSEQTNVTEEPGPAHRSARTGSSVAAVVLTTQALPSVAPVVLPEVLITVLGPRVRTIAVPAQGETLVPCTAWRNLAARGGFRDMVYRMRKPIFPAGDGYRGGRD